MTLNLVWSICIAYPEEVQKARIKITPTGEFFSPDATSTRLCKNKTNSEGKVDKSIKIQEIIKRHPPSGDRMLENEDFSETSSQCTDKRPDFARGRREIWHKDTIRGRKWPGLALEGGAWIGGGHISVPFEVFFADIPRIWGSGPLGVLGDCCGELSFGVLHQLRRGCCFPCLFGVTSGMAWGGVWVADLGLAGGFLVFAPELEECLGSKLFENTSHSFGDFDFGMGCLLGCLFVVVCHSDIAMGCGRLWWFLWGCRGWRLWLGWCDALCFGFFWT